MALASQRPNPSNRVRLQKYLAACGLGSRRFCETLIAGGRVSVNGVPVVEQGCRVDPGRDTVTVDGHVCRPQAKRYLILNKPAGFLCTSRDPQGRRTFLSLLPPSGERLFSVGRLDHDSEGLLLVTNDGEFALRLAHPRHWVAKTYLATIAGRLSVRDGEAMKAGIVSDGETLRAECVEFLRVWPRGASEYRVVLREGRKRQIRRMFASFGLKVLRLQRIAIGSLALGDLPAGTWRDLTVAELTRLRAESGVT